MLTEKEAFFSFVTEDECSSKNFYKAVKYFSQATFDEKEQFYQKIKNILLLCLDEMAKCHSDDLEIARKIYQRYGINDYYFNAALRFFEHNQSERDVFSIYFNRERIVEDAKDTATMIATEVGLLDKEDIVLTSEKLTKPSDEEIKKIAKSHADTNYSLYYEYLNQDLNFIHFCNLKGINFKRFQYVYKTIKNPDLAIKLEERIKKETIDNVNVQVYWCKELIDSIQNGITVNGIHRKFNLFDYFYYFGKYQIHRFFLPKLPLPQPEKTILSKFFAPLKRVNYMNQNTIIHAIYEFNPLHDEKGQLIKGTGRILSEEELQEIVNIFLEHQIPLYDILVSIAVRCYVDHSLIQEMSLQRK